MDDVIRYGLTGLSILLMWGCVARQRRYWREIRSNVPSGSVRAGYTVAFLGILTALGIATYSNTPSGWSLFVSIVVMAVMFCLKVTFSPAVLALTLAVCTIRLHTDGSYNLFEVWTAFASILTWRLPEGVRACYTYLSFIWVFIVVLFPATPNIGDSTEEAVNAVADSIHL